MKYVTLLKAYFVIESTILDLLQRKAYKIKNKHKITPN